MTSDILHELDRMMAMNLNAATRVRDQAKAEIESLRSRLAEADALLREALPSVQSHIRKHRRSWEAAMKRGDEFHTRKHCEQMNKDLALESRIDTHLARQP
jgi:hypothetical protein